MDARPPAAQTAQPYGEVFDRGYQHYAGPRLGRQHAIQALIWYSIKRGLGIKKRWTAKILPIILYAFAYTPAVIVVALLAFLESTVPGESPVNFGYSDLNFFTTFTLVLFAAAGAPEMLCDDRRENVLSLYFSRALTRLDYLAAKIVALTLLMATIAFGPALLLFLGKTLLDDNPLSAFVHSLDDLGKIALYGLTVSVLLGSVGLGIATYTNRKGVAAAIHIGGLLIVSFLANALFEALDADAAKYLVALSPIDLLSAINNWLFVTSADQGEQLGQGVPGVVLLAAVAAWAAVAGLIMHRRYLADE